MLNDAGADADSGAKMFINALQSRHGIDCVPVGGVIKKQFATKVTDNGWSRMHADAGNAPRHADGALPLLKVPAESIHFHGAVHTMPGMVWLLQRRTEHSAHGIPDNLIYRAPVSKYNPSHLIQVLVEQWHDDRWLQSLDEGHEISDVGENKRNVSSLASQIQRVGVIG